MRKCCRHTSLLTREYLFSAKGKIKCKNQEISEFEGSYSCIWKFYIIRRVCATLLLNIPQAFYGVRCDLLMEKEQKFYLSINTAIKASRFLFHELPVRVNIFTHVDLLPARKHQLFQKYLPKLEALLLTLINLHQHKTMHQPVPATPRNPPSPPPGSSLGISIFCLWRQISKGKGGLNAAGIDWCIKFTETIINTVPFFFVPLLLIPLPCFTLFFCCYLLFHQLM